MSCNGLLVFLIRVCTIAIIMEYLLGPIELLSELYEIVETIGG